MAADGEDLLPRAAQPGRKGRYQLSPRVLTDVDLIEHRFHTATGLASGDALRLLRDGLVWFGGPAFRGGGDGYGWIGPEGVLTRITNVVIAYATMLMELAFDADDLALVLQAAAAAGRVIDDPVALMPMSEVQRQFAEASGDPDLTAAVSRRTGGCVPTPMRTTRWRAADRPCGGRDRWLVGWPEFERRAAGAETLPPVGDEAGRGRRGRLRRRARRRVVVGGEGPDPGTEARLGELHAGPGRWGGAPGVCR